MKTGTMKELKYKKETVTKEDGRYIIFYEFDRSDTKTATSEGTQTDASGDEGSPAAADQ